MSRHAALLSLALISLTSCSLVPSPAPSLDGRVVDAAPPVFSNPTSITNPLFPVTEVTQLVQLGVDGGQPLRVEVTLMPETRTIDWDGGSIETVVAQFIAYRERRVIEVAYDFFAQADDGSVWYFGETVDNYSGGRISNHGGAWLAGVDGPPGMIMPGDPRVGDIYHPENIPGVVFEELIVRETGLSIDGPSGAIQGAINVEEHLMDGGTEHKIWAPGYGEFRAEAASELVTVALAVPTDALAGPVPVALSSMHTDSLEMVDAAGGGDGAAVEAGVAAIESGWGELREGSPALLAGELDAALGDLRAAVDAGDDARAHQAAIDLLFAVLDLELRHRAPAEVDLDRIAAWMRQLQLDAERGDRDAVVGDLAIGLVIWARTSHAFADPSTQQIGALLEAGLADAEAGDLAAARGVSDQVVDAALAAAAQ